MPVDIFMGFLHMMNFDQTTSDRPSTDGELLPISSGICADPFSIEFVSG